MSHNDIIIYSNKMLKYFNLTRDEITRRGTSNTPMANNIQAIAKGWIYYTLKNNGVANCTIARYWGTTENSVHGSIAGFRRLLEFNEEFRAFYNKKERYD